MEIDLRKNKKDRGIKIKCFYFSINNNKRLYEKYNYYIIRNILKIDSFILPVNVILDKYYKIWKQEAIRKIEYELLNYKNYEKIYNNF